MQPAHTTVMNSNVSLILKRNGNPNPRNMFGYVLMPLQTGISKLYDTAMELDRDVSLHVINALTIG